jgi:hypothetical protein
VKSLSADRPPQSASWTTPSARSAEQDAAKSHLVGVRQDPGQPWMSLLGLVANDQTDAAGKTVCPHQLLVIGVGTTADVHHPGYLNAFANDAWGFYGNNGGAVQLRITRTWVRTTQRMDNARPCPTQRCHRHLVLSGDKAPRGRSDAATPAPLPAVYHPST